MISFHASQTLYSRILIFDSDSGNLGGAQDLTFLRAHRWCQSCWSTLDTLIIFLSWLYAELPILLFVLILAICSSSGDSMKFLVLALIPRPSGVKTVLKASAPWSLDRLRSSHSGECLQPEKSPSSIPLCFYFYSREIVPKLGYFI